MREFLGGAAQRDIQVVDSRENRRLDISLKLSPHSCLKLLGSFSVFFLLFLLLILQLQILVYNNLQIFCPFLISILDKAFSELFQRHKDVFPIIVHTGRLQMDVLLSELGK